MSNQKVAKVNKKRWAAYAAAGVAATLAGAQSAEADITHVVLGAGVGDWNPGDDLYFALDGSAALNFFNPGAPDVALLGVFNGTFFGAVAGFTNTGNNFPYAANLASGANISTQGFIASTRFGTLVYGGGYANEAFGNGGLADATGGGFLGFQFDIGGGAQYGWARVTYTGALPGGPNSFVIEEYAWGMAGEAVAVGQTSSGAIPEPTSLGLLALGAIGVAANRRRKQLA